jgi:hypothetical protein
LGCADHPSIALQIRFSRPLLNGMRTGWNLRRILLDCLFLTVFGLTLIAGGTSFKKTYPIIMGWAGPTIPESMKQQVAAINAVVPEGAPVFFIQNDPDLWIPRLWQRALHPRAVFVISSAEQVKDPWYLKVKQKHSIRYAISWGTPPIDPSFIHSTKIGLPGAEDTMVVGELAP